MEWLPIMLLLCSFKTARGLKFTTTPDRVVLGDSGTLTLACYVTESDVNQVVSISIIRAVKRGSTNMEKFASFVRGTAKLDDGITDDKGFSVTGVLDGASSRLEVSMDKSKMACSDARLYECGMVYDNTILGKIEIVSTQITLQVFVLPQVIPPLQARKNGKLIEGGTQSDRAKFVVGDQLELQCKANIGSINSTTIRWRKTSEMDSGQFVDYQPPGGSYDDGTPLSDSQCGYTRTATIRYNVTTPVANYDLAFECYVSVSGYPSSTPTPSGLYTTKKNLRYHVEMLRETSQSTTERQTTQTLSTLDVVTSCACSTNIASLVGVAIGSVAATLIVTGIVLVVTKCLRMQNGKKKESKVDISMTHDAVDTYHVYINEEQHQANTLDHAAPAEYEVLQESARELNTYSDLYMEQ